MNKSKTVVKKTRKIAKTIMKKTQEIFEISQLNLKIMQLKNRLERKYVKIGYCVYNKYKEYGLESLRKSLGGKKFEEICKEIEDLYDEIEKLEKELEEIKKDNMCLCDCKEEKYDEHKKYNIRNYKDEDYDY